MDNYFNELYSEYINMREKASKRVDFVIYVKGHINCQFAILKYLLILFFLIFYFLISIYLIDSYVCEDIEKDKTMDFYWICSTGKCGVIKKKYEIGKILRISNFIIFEFFPIIYKGLFLKFFFNKKYNHILVLGFKIFEYLFIIIIYCYELFDNKKCINSINDGNLFFKPKKNYLINITFLCLDLIIKNL